MFYVSLSVNYHIFIKAIRTFVVFYKILNAFIGGLATNQIKQKRTYCNKSFYIGITHDTLNIAKGNNNIIKHESVVLFVGSVYCVHFVCYVLLLIGFLYR